MAFLKDGDRDALRILLINDFQRLKALDMVTVRTGGAVDSDRSGHRASPRDDNFLSSTRGENPTERVVDIRGALDDARFVTTQCLQPRRRLRKILAKLVSSGASALSADNAGRKSSRLGLDSEIVDGGNRRLIAIVLALEKALDQCLVDVPKEVLNWLVLHHRPLCRNWALQNAYTPGILVERGVDILGGPKRILRDLR